jgi:cobalt-zinc-cadmium efflux system protein
LLLVSRAARLWIVLFLNLLLVGGLVLVGISAHSFGVLAEGADYLADAAAIGVSLVALWLARRPRTPTRPRGYPRATAFAALVNGGWLLVLSVLVTEGAVDRLATGGHHVHGLTVLIVSGIAATVMLAAILILGHDEGEDDDENGDLNMRAVLLDTAADATAAAGVAVTGGIILATGGLYWLDPAVAIVISGAAAYHAIRLLRRLARALSLTSATSSRTPPSQASRMVRPEPTPTPYE